MKKSNWQQINTKCSSIQEYFNLIKRIFFGNESILSNGELHLLLVSRMLTLMFVILQTMRNDCEKNSWHESLQLVLHRQTAQTVTCKLRSPVVAGKWLPTAFLRTVSSHEKVHDSDQNRDSYCIKWLYNSSKWDVEKNRARAAECEWMCYFAGCCQIFVNPGCYYWEPQWHIWLIIIEHSYPPRHGAATHLCHMMINNAIVRGAMISH